MIRLALRFDDPSATSDRALEEAILDAARSARIPMTLAVIPFKRQSGELIGLTADRARHLIQAQRDGAIEIAQHGYCHEAEKRADAIPSEFSGVRFERQLERIRRGRTVLGEFFCNSISGFVPPWNTYDASTTRALVQGGFHYLSAGEEVDPACSNGLAYLPRTCQMTNLPGTIDAITPFATLDPVIIAVMHHYDFAESGSPKATIDLDRFGALLQNLRQDTRLQISTLSGLMDSPCAALSSRLRQNAWRRLHWRIKRRLPDHAMFRQSWPRLILRGLHSA